ncbi:hypothetical protein [Beijerinckia indica]|uniref:hypothetical protein n=1 Tax=Beijerinckia indica TaxID=533 RepID=UPI00031A7841|nr:hypothetical protein [Beijerinckia indica]
MFNTATEGTNENYESRTPSLPNRDLRDHLWTGAGDDVRTGCDGSVDGLEESA